MRKRLHLFVVIALLGALLVMPTVAQAATPADVNGTWTSVDIDGSNQVMDVRVNPANRARIVLHDDDGMICGGGSPLVAKGNGTLTGDVITVAYTIKCDNGVKATVTGFTYVFDSTTGTLTDAVGVVWTRP